MCEFKNEMRGRCCRHEHGDREPGFCGKGEPMMHRHHDHGCGGRGFDGPHFPHRMGPHRPMDEEAYNALDADAKLGILFHQTHHMTRFFFESRGGQHRALAILAREGDMTQRELTERLAIRPGSASELIGKLERAGWITRTESAEDRRTADVHLTESGREQAENGRPEKPELFTALNDEEKAQLVALLEKLRADWRGKLFADRPERPERGCRRHDCHRPDED